MLTYFVLAITLTFLYPKNVPKINVWMASAFGSPQTGCLVLTAIKTMQAKLIIAFDRLGDVAFDAKTVLIHTSLTGNVNFPLPWPPFVPQLTDIGAAKDTYHGLFEATQAGDASKISARDDARTMLTTLLKKLAPYLELVADGSIPKLESTGYDLRHDIVQSESTDPLPPPPPVSPSRGAMPAAPWWPARAACPGAGSYILEICAGDPSVEANWTLKGTFLHCSKIVTDGYVPGRIYYGRLQGVGPNGPGLWAVSPGIMAV